jgi:LysW-gamma-L-lysine carboxypeptidase
MENRYNTLVGLVQHYSPSGEERGAVEFLVKRMHELGFDRSFIDEVGNAVGLIGEGPRQVVLLGQIPVKRDGDILYGRGSVDAKGPLAAFVDAAARAGRSPGWQVVVIGAVEEERDSDGARFAVSRYRPDFTIIGEPSQWERVTLGYKGSAWARITVRRALAHTAGQGESACEMAVTAWEKIRASAESLNAGRPRAFDQILLTLRELNSGDDGFEEWASLRVGARLPPEVPPEAWYEHLNGLVSGAEVEPIGFAIPAYLAEKNTALVRAFLSGVRAAGGKPTFVLKTGTADLNIVAPVWGCPAVAYGPGDSGLDHTPGEHLSLAEYAHAAEVLEKVLKQLMG